MAQVLSLLIALLSFIPASPATDTITPVDFPVQNDDSVDFDLSPPIVQAAEVFYEPKLLKISSINLNAPIISVGADVDGTQLVPDDNGTLSWWKKGAKPGESGSAVLAGHYKIDDGSPGVFYKLNEVSIGEIISIVDEKGAVQNFKVIDTKVFSVEDFPTKSIYSASDQRYLNLVTCTGEYVSETNDYTHRLVVYTTKVSNE